MDEDVLRLKIRDIDNPNVVGKIEALKSACKIDVMPSEDGVKISVSGGDACKKMASKVLFEE